MESVNSPANETAPSGSQPPIEIEGEHRHDRNRRLRQAYLAAEAEKLQAEEAGDDQVVRQCTSILERIKNDVIRENDGLAKSLALRFASVGTVSEEDLFQEGRLQLFRAFTSWKPGSGTLATWAVSFISGGVRREVHRNERPEISYADWSAAPKVAAAERELTALYGRSPTHAEVAAATELTETLVERVRKPRPTSLDLPVGEDGGNTLGDLVAERFSATGGVDDDERDLVLQTLHAVTSPLEYYIALRHSGFDGGPVQTLVQIGADINMGRETVRRRHDQAIEKVKAALRDRPVQLAL